MQVTPLDLTTDDVKDYLDLQHARGELFQTTTGERIDLICYQFDGSITEEEAEEALSEWQTARNFQEVI